MNTQAPPSVFISWSGEEAEQVGKILSEWLKRVYQRIDVFYSPESIKKGFRGLAEISGAIDRASAAIVVVTPHSFNSPWVNFEAGALQMETTTSGTKRRVIPFLVGLSSVADVSGPLDQFQMVTRARGDVIKMIKSLNEVMGIDEEKAESMIEPHWAAFTDELDAIVLPESVTPPPRTDRELLEEILELQREQSARKANRVDLTHVQSSTTSAANWEIINALVRSSLNSEDAQRDRETLELLLALREGPSSKEAKMSPAFLRKLRRLAEERMPESAEQGDSNDS